MLTYVVIYCETDVRRNALLELIKDMNINTIEDTTTVYNEKISKYEITVCPYDKDTGKLNTLLFNAMTIKLIEAFHKVKSDSETKE